MIEVSGELFSKLNMGVYVRMYHVINTCHVLYFGTVHIQ